MPLKEDIFGGNSKPHGDFGSVGSEHFGARLALTPRHLRVKHFTSRGSKIMIQLRDCESFSNFKCCVLEIALEPQRVGNLKLFPVNIKKVRFLFSKICIMPIFIFNYVLQLQDGVSFKASS
jgi:hypothetical protein